MGSLADDTRWMDALDQAALVRRGDVSARELIDAAIERTEALNPQLNAVIIDWFDEARQAATVAAPAWLREQCPPYLQTLPLR